MSVINQMLIDLEERRAADRPAIEARQTAYVMAGAPRRTRASSSMVAWCSAALAIVALAFAAQQIQYGAALELLDRALSNAVAATRDGLGDDFVATRTIAAVPRLNPHPPQSLTQSALASVAQRDSVTVAQNAVRDQQTKAKPVVSSVERQPAPDKPQLLLAKAAPREEPEKPQPARANEVRMAAPEVPARATKKTRMNIVPREASPEDRFAQLLGDARHALAQGDTVRANSLVQQALRLAPGNAAAAELLFAVQLRSGDTDAAVATLRDVLARDPYNVAYAKALARLLASRGQYQPAIDHLRAALAAGREDSHSLALLAGLERRVGDHEAAAAHYLDALAFDRTVAVWWMGLGMSLESLHQPEEARAAFSEAKRIGGLDGDVAAFVEQRLTELGTGTSR